MQANALHRAQVIIEFIYIITRLGIFPLQNLLAARKNDAHHDDAHLRGYDEQTGLFLALFDPSSDSVARL